MYGISKLDEFYQAPMKWPETNRTDNIENTFLKVAALSQNTLTPQTSLPFSAIESKFLIGLTFRLILRDIIYTSQRRDNLGVLHHPIWNWRRNPVYQEILQYSYEDYFEKFAIPYYSGPGTGLARGGDNGKSRRLADVCRRPARQPRHPRHLQSKRFSSVRRGPGLASRHVCAGSIDRLPARRSLGKSFQSNGAKIHFGSAGGLETSPTKIQMSH